MFFRERLKDLIKENQLTYSAVATKTGIPITTLSNYINRGSSPSIIQLSLLADFFEVSVDYLIGRSDDFGNVNVITNGAELSKDEKTLLDCFNKLGPFEHEAILIQVKALAKKWEEKEAIKK